MKTLFMTLLSLALTTTVRADDVNVANLNTKIDKLIEDIIKNDPIVSSFSFQLDPTSTNFNLPILDSEIKSVAPSTEWQKDKPSYFNAKIYLDLQKMLQTGEIVIRFHSELITAQVPMLKFMGAKGLERIQNGTALDLEKDFEQTYTKLSNLVTIDKMQTIFTTAATDVIEIWNKKILELEKQLAVEQQQDPQDPVVIGYLQKQIADLNKSIDAVLLFNFKKVSENGVFQKVLITHPNPVDVLSFAGFNIPTLKDFKMEVSDTSWTIDGELVLIDDQEIFQPLFLDNIEDFKLFEKGDAGAEQRVKENVQKSFDIMKTLLKGEIPALGPETFFHN